MRGLRWGTLNASFLHIKQERSRLDAGRAWNSHWNVILKNNARNNTKKRVRYRPLGWRERLGGAEPRAVGRPARPPCSTRRGRERAAQYAGWPTAPPAPRPAPGHMRGGACAHTHSLILIQLVQPATPEKSNSISALCSSTIPPSRCSQSWGTGASFKNTCMPSMWRCICHLSLRLYTPFWLLTREERNLGWVWFHFLN